MPAVHRKVTQATGLVSKALVAFEEEQELRAHDFSAAAARLEAANVLGGGFIAVRGVATRDQPALRLVNRLPHALPTGGFGAGTVRIEIHVPAAAPIVRTLSTRPGMALAPGAALDVALPDEARGSGVQVEVLRVTSDGAPLLLWRGEVPVPAKGREDSPP
jgi:hypothetical protein